MDRLDVRIVRALLSGGPLLPLATDFRESLASVSRKVGADEATVRHRLKRLEASGFLVGWHLMMNPRLWGGGQVWLYLDVDPTSSKRDLVEKLRLVPGVVIVNACYDGLNVFLNYEDEVSLPRHVELVRQLAGTSGVLIARVPFPECGAALNPRDWDLVRALRQEPRMPYGHLAEAVGQSSRTAKVRLARLMSHGVAFALPVLNMRAAPGSVFCQFLVRYPGERRAEVDGALAAQLEPYLCHVYRLMPYRNGDPWSAVYELHVPSMPVMRELLECAKDAPGVASAQAHLQEEIFYFLDSYDEVLDAKLSRMPSAVPKVDVDRRRRVPSGSSPRARNRAR